MEIKEDNLTDNGVIKLLEEHLADMYATSPPESVHALDVESLKSNQITFWCAREKNIPLGCIALKHLNDYEAEIKSMRTTAKSRGKGVATSLLKTLLSEAVSRGYISLKLETGSQDFFEPARNLYEKFGFNFRGPFGSYANDPNSMFMELDLSSHYLTNLSS